MYQKQNPNIRGIPTFKQFKGLLLPQNL